MEAFPHDIAEAAVTPDAVNKACLARHREALVKRIIEAKNAVRSDYSTITLDDLFIGPNLRPLFEELKKSFPKVEVKTVVTENMKETTEWVDVSNAEIPRYSMYHSIRLTLIQK